MRQQIVAEVTKNWPSENPELISRRFEDVILHNAALGYKLECWQLSRVALGLSASGVAMINETIVAVFVKST